MSRLNNRSLPIAMALALLAAPAAAAAYEDDIPAPLTDDDLSPPLGAEELPGDGVPEGVLRPPVPIPAPHEVRPPVPIPAPHEVRSPVPIPAPREVEPPPAAGPPWAALPESVKGKWASVVRRLRGWGVSCQTERRGDQREIRCTLSEPRHEGPTAAPPRSDGCGSGEEARLFALLNAERRRRGLGPLACSARAVEVARAHSQDMCSRRFFGHFTPEGGNPGRRLRGAGIRHRAAGENIARGHNSAAGVHAGWMGSPAHRRTMLSAAYTHVGIGLVECDSTGPYWTEVFFR